MVVFSKIPGVSGKCLVAIENEKSFVLPLFSESRLKQTFFSLKSVQVKMVSIMNGVKTKRNYSV